MVMAVKAVRNILRATCRDAKDRSATAGVHAAFGRCAVKGAVYVDQGGIGIRAVGPSKSVQHALRAARRNAKDRSAVVIIRLATTPLRAPFLRRAVERPGHVEDACAGAVAIRGAPKLYSTFSVPPVVMLKTVP